MLTWWRESYEVTAGDAASTIVTRLWTPDGINHDPLATGKGTQRQDWRVETLHVWVLRTTTGTLKRGVLGELVRTLENCWSFVPLSSHRFGPLGGLWTREPFVCTHGFGWAFYRGALAQTDKVYMRALYEPIGPKGV